MYKTIMVAVDGSSVANLALAEASRLGKALGSTVHLVHVVDDGYVLYDVGYLEPTMLNQALIDAGRKILDTAQQSLIADGVQCSTRLIEEPFSPSDIAITIEQAAREAKAELIIMGTHGRRGVKRLVMGSVAEGVLRLSKAPVLMVRGD